mmetsp:Transcript_12874/g.29204  ORF Transcript_12874/g.29204 Transcript_12874/m.29204 type:complete len:933 (-) Transcript_12874:63-2861(-)
MADIRSGEERFLSKLSMAVSQKTEGCGMTVGHVRTEGGGAAVGHVRTEGGVADMSKSGEDRFREQLSKLSMAVKTEGRRPKSAGYVAQKRAIGTEKAIPARTIFACPRNVTTSASTPALAQGCSVDSSLDWSQQEVEQPPPKPPTRPSTALSRRPPVAEHSLSASCPMAPPPAGVPPLAPVPPAPVDDADSLPRLLRAFEEGGEFVSSRGGRSPGSRPDWLQAFQHDVLETMREELRAVNREVADIRQEVKTSAAMTSSNLAAGFSQVSAALCQSLAHGQQLSKAGGGGSDLDRIVEEIRSLKRGLDSRPASPGKRNGPVAFVGVDNRDHRLDARLGTLQEEVAKLREQMNFAPVLDAIREQRPQVDVSRIIEHIRKGRAEVDMSALLEEVQRARSEVDFSPVLEAIRDSGAKPDARLAKMLEEVRGLRQDLANRTVDAAEAVPRQAQSSHATLDDMGLASLLEEVRSMRHELTSRANEASKADSSAAVLDEIRKISTRVSLMRRTPSKGLPESTHGGNRLHAVIQRVIVDARAQAPDRTRLQASEIPRSPSKKISYDDEVEEEEGEDAVEAPRVDPAEGARIAEAIEAQEQLMETEELKSDLYALRWELQRLEALMEKKTEDYHKFVEGVTRSSARPALSEAYDLSRAELLGRGHYGYVMRCTQRGTGDQVVAKVLSERWARVVVGEWAHGSDSLEHPNIVRHIAVFMHRDSEGDMRKRLKAAFDAGTLPGKCPVKFPESYFCLILEFMDRGSAKQLVDKGSLRLEGLAAITRQVASALAFMHKRKRTHNDVKPENILLKHSPEDGCLTVKLADLGLAEHSTDRTRDHDLLAYSIWCMALGRSFGQCPGGERRDAALEELRSLSTERHDSGLAAVLAKLVHGLWRSTMGMAEVAATKELQGLEVHFDRSRENSRAGMDLELPLTHARTIRS